MLPQKRGVFTHMWFGLWTRVGQVLKICTKLPPVISLVLGFITIVLQKKIFKSSIYLFFSVVSVGFNELTTEIHT
jgi:hypothetical protein